MKPDQHTPGLAASEWLLIHGGALGDLALMLRLVLRLPGMAQAAGVHVLSRVDPGDLSDATPRVMRLASDALGTHWLHTTGHDPPPPLLEDSVRGRRVLCTLADDRSPLRRRLRALNPASVHMLDPAAAPDSPRHIVDQWRHRLAGGGLLVPECVRKAAPTVRPSAEMRAHGRRLIASALPPITPATERPPMLIHPGSGGRQKCWPLAGFMALAELARRSGWRVVFLLGPVEEESWPAPDVADLVANDALLRGLSAADLAAALCAGAVLVGNDSGPAHLAALLGTPTVTLFGPTPAAIWKPLGSRAAVVSDDPAAGDLWGIAPQRVLAAAMQAAGVDPSPPTA